MRQKGFDFGDPGAPRQGKAGQPPRREPRPPAAVAPPRTGAGGERARRPRALTVSELTDRIQGVLETELFDVWVEGEVSNLKLADSGHWYFSLKDARAQIHAVVWKTDARLIRFRPKDGMKVLARGSVRVYPPRGEYQLAAQVLEPLGKGSLQQAYEELKQKLEQEGLFDQARKRALPMLPRRVGVVSSPTGAVIRDILRVLRTRYANIELLLYPARVQGEGAAEEIVKGIRVLNGIAGLDVILLARGGGSLEDLWAFNEEPVARAIAASRVPTISAVGHETDFTIADFVADLRAATPSAAAERVVQAKDELLARVAGLERRRDAALRLALARSRARLERAAAQRVFAAERGRLRVAAQAVDDLVRRARAGLVRHGERARERSARLRERLEAFRLDRQVANRRERLARHGDRLEAVFRAEMERRRSALARAASSLEGLSPLAVLGRGYAVVFDETAARVLRDASAVAAGERLRIRLHRGALRATVDARETETE
jgi:exodeoxyribonuclease VII large subunit